MGPRAPVLTSGLPEPLPAAPLPRPMPGAVEVPPRPVPPESLAGLP